jgi:hypothetical protein
MAPYYKHDPDENPMQFAFNSIRWAADYDAGWAQSGNTGPYWDAFRQFIAPEREGYRDLAGFNAAKGLEVDRAEARNELADKFFADSEAFSAQAQKQAQYSADFSSRMLDNQARLAQIRQKSEGAVSSASSQREFSQLAQESITGTRRYLEELERFRTPSGPAIDYSFTDPITGEKLDLDADFDNIYSGGYDPAALAREGVMKKYNTAFDAAVAEAGAWVSENFTNPSEYDDAMIARLQEGAQNNTLRDAEEAYLNQYKTDVRAYDQVSGYAEAAALAELGGFTENLSIQPFWAKQELEYDPASIFYGADTNALLEDYIAKSTERMGVSNLSDENQARREFERRRDVARTQFGLYENQQRFNAAEAERIEVEKQRTRQQLENQMADYQSTMATFGPEAASMGQGISFADTRPQ